MLKLLKIYIVLVLFVTSLVADDKSYVKDNFSKIINDVLVVVKNKKLSADERNRKIVEIVTPIFDFALMGKLSLGKKWKTLSRSDRKEFVSLYVERMKKSYSAKLDAYNDEVIVIKEVKQPKKNRIILFSTLESNNNSLSVNYKYYKPKKSKKGKQDWLIYDVEIEGVSILKTDKAQFKEYLKTHTLSQLIDSMRAKK